MAKKKLLEPEARRLYVEEGFTLAEISAHLELSDKTVRTWKASCDWETARADHRKTGTQTSAQAIKEKIDKLSRKKDLSKADALTIERLSKAHDRVEKLEQKKRDKNKQIKVETLKLTPTMVDGLRKKALSEEYGLYEHQHEILADDNRFRGVVASRQVGKSYLVALDALLSACGGAMDSIVISGSQDQANIILRYAQEHADKLGIDVLPGGKLRDSLICPGGKHIICRPPNMRTIQGFSGSLYMDEFAWVRNAKQIWEAAIPFITAVNGRVTVSSTPFEKGNFFWRIMEETDEQGQYKMKRFSRHRITIHDAIRAGMQIDIEDLRDLFDAEAFRRLYECEYFTDEESFFTFDEVKAMMRDCLDENTTAELYGGYDIGRKIDASEQVLVEQGIHADDIPSADAALSDTDRLALAKVIVRVMKSLKRTSFDDQKAFLRSCFGSYRITKQRIDCTGMGINLAEDMAREYPAKVESLWFTQQLKEELALNVKKLAEDKRAVIPIDQTFAAQILSIKRQAGQTGFKYDSARNAEVGHADKFWAWAMACRGLGFRKSREVKVRVF